MSEATVDGQEQPITAEWLKANTRIHGWFAFFIFALALGGLLSLVRPIATYKPSDYLGSMLLGMTDIAMGVVMAIVALWTIVSLCRRSPAAIFWGKFYTVLVLLTNGIALWTGDNAAREMRMAAKGIVWATVGYLFSTFTRLAISRSREYVADAGGAELCGDPLALASALKKISENPGLSSLQQDDVAQLYVIHPDEEFDNNMRLTGWVAKANAIFCTHPDTPERIRLLEQF